MWDIEQVHCGIRELCPIPALFSARAADRGVLPAGDSHRWPWGWAGTPHCWYHYHLPVRGDKECALLLRQHEWQLGQTTHLLGAPLTAHTESTGTDRSKEGGMDYPRYISVSVWSHNPYFLWRNPILNQYTNIYPKEGEWHNIKLWYFLAG